MPIYKNTRLCSSAERRFQNTDVWDCSEIRFQNRLVVCDDFENGFSLIFIDSGHGKVTFHAFTLPYNQNEMIFCKSGRRVEFKADGISTITCLHVDEYSELADLPEFTVVATPANLIDNHIRSTLSGEPTEISFGLLHSCLAAVAIADECLRIPSYLMEAKEMLNKDYRQQLSLDYICTSLKINKYRFIKDFRQFWKTTPIEYLCRIRLDASCRLLAGTDYKISEIAETVGFSSAAYYIQRFKRKYGVTPARYRTNIDKLRHMEIETEVLV